MRIVVSKSWALGCLALSLGILLLDQWTKEAVLARFLPGETLPIIDGFFNLTLVYNRGVAFGMFSGLGDVLRPLMLFGVTALALTVLAYLFFVEFARERVEQLALAAIFGGALGNILDRFQHGAVVDFLDFYYGSYHWPAFNVADSAICVGVSVLVLSSLFRHRLGKAEVDSEGLGSGTMIKSVDSEDLGRRDL